MANTLPTGKLLLRSGHPAEWPSTARCSVRSILPSITSKSHDDAAIVRIAKIDRIVAILLGSLVVAIYLLFSPIGLAGGALTGTFWALIALLAAGNIGCWLVAARNGAAGEN
ncbi:hypothetical protein [Allopontixanthobacter sp.]|uniref:hypothetical protein n=1 Tax=Allopontixanthobacter sp. TaxID=2906452 RepID=UPI002AB9EFEF|nr:hypothetical protein [Allopontixanthobacter sp.]MDZ4307094.1 hypothetical protein [Allopontixanthobacter sp.]